MFQSLVNILTISPQENISLNMSELEGDLSTPAPLVSTLDRPPASRLVRASQTELRGAERRGLLWLLDGEALQPTPSDAGFLKTVMEMYNSRGEPGWRGGTRFVLEVGVCQIVV